MAYGSNPHGGIPLFENQRFFLQAFDVVDEFGVAVVDIRKLLRERIDLFVNRVIVGVQLFFVFFEVFAACSGSLRNPSAVSFSLGFTLCRFLFKLPRQVGRIGKNAAHFFCSADYIFTVAHVLVIRSQEHIMDFFLREVVRAAGRFVRILVIAAVDYSAIFVGGVPDFYAEEPAAVLTDQL